MRRTLKPRTMYTAVLLALSLPSLAQTPPASENQINILFFGNSYTSFFLEQRSVPDLVSDIAESAGRSNVTTVEATRNGRDFAWHVSTNQAVIRDAIEPEQDWHFVVMQNFSTRPTTSHPAGDREQHRTNAVALYQAVALRSPEVIPVLFQTWSRGPTNSQLVYFEGGQPQMLEELRDGYQLAADDIDASVGMELTRIGPVGESWANASYDDVYAPDETHANARGRLLSALVIYSTIFDDDTGDLLADGALDGVLELMGLDATDGAFLTRVSDLTTGLAAGCLADTNNDGLVRPDDFSAWVIAYNDQLPTCDQNQDGQCDPSDFNAWVLNFNAGCP